MARAPGHKFGQIIGELLESVVRPQLESFCEKHKLYLDNQKKIRPARTGKKITWTDKYGNKHDLDFVIEIGGTDNKIGTPLAFIECAWRRYTKHSKNKAQEIQGAILPLAETHHMSNPFLGTVLAGDFTQKSLNQLRSLGFNVLYFPYDSLVAAFQSEGIDILFNQRTKDRIFHLATKQIISTSPEKMARIRTHLVRANQEGITVFLDTLNKRLSRHVTRVIVIPLYGSANEFSTIEDAVKFLDTHRKNEGSIVFHKYEIRIEFSNGDKINASIEAKEKVKEFFAFVARQ